jgi:hypothetical protein
MSKQVNMHHNDLPSVIAFIDAASRTWSSRNSMHDDRDYSWDLGAGYEGALALARTGWIDGAERMSVALEALPAIHRAPKQTYGYVGSKVSSARFAAFNPKCMIKRKPDSGNKPVVRIAVYIAANWMADAQAMSNYGLAIARYVDEMEATGRRCEVIAALAMDFSTGGKSRVCHSWTVKNADEPMSLADMAFSVGHPAAFRRLGFALIERTPIPMQGNYGIPKQLVATDLPRDDYIILNGMNEVNSFARTYEGALAYVRLAINDALGIESEEAA